VRARAAVRAVADRGTTVLEDLRGEAPLGVWRGGDAAPGWAQVWLVGSAAGPLGGDDVELRIEVGDGAALEIGSVAASVALAGAAPSVTRVHATVGADASLIWYPEPLVVTGRADHRVEVHIIAAADSCVWWRDELVLGRSGELPGRCTLSLRATLGGLPWLHHDLAVGEPGWDGPAVVASSRCVGSVLTTERLPPSTRDRAAVLHPAAGGALALALAADRVTLDRLLPIPPVQRSDHVRLPPRVNAGDRALGVAAQP